MKTVHLLRHAKSSWKDPTLNDHERALSKRGRAAAKAMAKHLEREKMAPDVVLCSTAVRAKETLDPIAKRLRPAKVVFEAGVYEGAQRKLWKYLLAVPEPVQTVLMIGHNPGLRDLASELADAGSLNQLPSSEGKFPTGALASFSFDGMWKDLQPHSAHLISFVAPRQLPSAKR